MPQEPTKPNQESRGWRLVPQIETRINSTTVETIHMVSQYTKSSNSILLCKEMKQTPLVLLAKDLVLLVLTLKCRRS
jgi:hypothetical protein